MKIFLLLFLIFFIWLSTLLSSIYFLPDWTIRGQFGDLFGSINALFSGLAFAGLIYTIFLQRKELELQREELKLQREEMAKSREELAEQARVQKAQFIASISKLRADAISARIEANKVLAESRSHSSKGEYAQLIVEESKKIDGLASDLEKYLGHSASDENVSEEK